MEAQKTSMWEKSPPRQTFPGNPGAFPPCASVAQARLPGRAYPTTATQANATRASVGTPKRAVWRAGRPAGKCFTYSSLQAS